MSEALVQETKKLTFWEEDLLVKTLDDEEEWRQSYRLRHRIFAERLQWVPERADELETDIYDSWSNTIGLFAEGKQLLGIVRMTQAPLPFMLESEFSACLVGAHEVRKATDTAEITRLAVDPGIEDRALSLKAMRILTKGAYQWCVAHDVRYTYLVVENRLLRALRLMGWPCRPIGEPVALPPAEVLSIAALIDLDEFRMSGTSKRPEVVEWFSTIEHVQVGSSSATRPRRVLCADATSLKGKRRGDQSKVQWERGTAKLPG
jgi:acyl homoserine lactone synthase